MTKSKMRKLLESSWLAQILDDMMKVEFDTYGFTSRWSCMEILKFIVNEADNPDNQKIYYSEGKQEIILCEIPSLIQHGSDFDLDGVQNKLRGLSRYKDEFGNETVIVKTTHDLNSGTIKISDLMYQIRFGNYRGA